MKNLLIENIQILLSSPRVQAIVLTIWLLLCVLFLLLFPLFGQIVVMLVTFLVVGGCLVICRLSDKYHRYMNDNCSQSIFQPQSGTKHIGNHAVSSRLLTIATVVTGASATLLLLAYLLPVLAGVSQLEEGARPSPTIVILEPVIVQQRVQQVGRVLLSEFQSLPSPTPYVILSRPTPINQPMPTFTPVPALLSNYRRSLDLYRLLPRVIISHVFIPPKNASSLDSYIILTNNSEEINIDGWTLANEDQRSCTFHRALLERNSITRVGGRIANKIQPLILCEGDTTLWTSMPKILKLEDSMGNLVDRWTRFEVIMAKPVEVQ